MVQIIRQGYSFVLLSNLQHFGKNKDPSMVNTHELPEFGSAVSNSHSGSQQDYTWHPSAAQIIRTSGADPRKNNIAKDHLTMNPIQPKSPVVTESLSTDFDMDFHHALDTAFGNDSAVAVASQYRFNRHIPIAQVDGLSDVLKTCSTIETGPPPMWAVDPASLPTPASSIVPEILEVYIPRQPHRDRHLRNREGLTEPTQTTMASTIPGKGRGFPCRDYGNPDFHTALASHAQTLEEDEWTRKLERRIRRQNAYAAEVAAGSGGTSTVSGTRRLGSKDTGMFLGVDSLAEDKVRVRNPCLMARLWEVFSRR